MIGDEKREELLRELVSGPNVVEIAGVEMSVVKKGKASSKWLEISYRPGSAVAFEAAVKVLKGAEFVERGTSPPRSRKRLSRASVKAKSKALYTLRSQPASGSWRSWQGKA